MIVLVAPELFPAKVPRDGFKLAFGLAVGELPAVTFVGNTVHSTLQRYKLWLHTHG